MFLGVRTDVPDVLAALDVAVSSSDFEGSPLSVMEYMEAARPIVATRVGGVPDLIDDGVHGLLGRAAGPRRLRRRGGADCCAIRDAARAMGERARERRRTEFDIDVMVRRLEELYAELRGEARDDRVRDLGRRRRPRIVARGHQVVGERPVPLASRRRSRPPSRSGGIPPRRCGAAASRRRASARTGSRGCARHGAARSRAPPRTRPPRRRRSRPAPCPGRRPGPRATSDTMSPYMIGSSSTSHSAGCDTSWWQTLSTSRSSNSMSG